MKRPSLIVGLIATAAVVLALSACAPAVHGGPSASPSKSSHPHPTPTPTQAAVPSVRVPLKCGSLFSDATVGTLIDGPVKYHIDESTNPVDITSIVARQYGTLICLWGGAGRTDGGYDENLTLEISPDASAGFASNISEIEQESQPVVLNTAGDQSEYTCGVPGEFQCTANMLVGTFWVTATLQDLGNGTIAQSVAKTRIQQVLTTLAADLKTATALPAWNPPGPALPSFCSESNSTAEVNTAFGATDFGVAGQDSAPADAESYTQQPGIYTQCTWSSAASKGKFTFLEIGMVRGGAWVMPELAGELGDENYLLPVFSTISIPGASSAVSSCSTAAQQCEVLLSIGSLFVSLELDDAGPALVTPALTKIVADISSS